MSKIAELAKSKKAPSVLTKDEGVLFDRISKFRIGSIFLRKKSAIDSKLELMKYQKLITQINELLGQPNDKCTFVQASRNYKLPKAKTAASYACIYLEGSYDGKLQFCFALAGAGVCKNFLLNLINKKPLDINSSKAVILAHKTGKCPPLVSEHIIEKFGFSFERINLIRHD